MGSTFLGEWILLWELLWIANFTSFFLCLFLSLFFYLSNHITNFVFFLHSCFWFFFYFLWNPYDNSNFLFSIFLLHIFLSFFLSFILSFFLSFFISFFSYFFWALLCFTYSRYFILQLLITSHYSLYIIHFTNFRLPSSINRIGGGGVGQFNDQGVSSVESYSRENSYFWQVNIVFISVSTFQCVWCIWCWRFDTAVI